MGLGNILLLVQATIYVVAFILSFFIFIPLSIYQKDFHGRCILFSSGSWDIDNSTQEQTPLLKVDWGDSGYCEYAVFIGVLLLPLSFFYIITISIHLFKGSEQSWLQTFLCLVTNFVMFALVLVCGIILSAGFKQWCALLGERNIDCDIGEFVAYKIDNDQPIDKGGFYIQFGMAQFGVWCSWICWLLLSGCACVKLYRFHQQEDFFTSMMRERQRLIQHVSHEPQTI